MSMTTVYMIYVPYSEEDEARGDYKPSACWPADPKKIGMINNCNFYMPIYDFYDLPEAEMRHTTQHLGTVPGAVPEADAEAGAVMLPIPAASYPGITIAELVAAEEYERLRWS